MRFWHIAAFFIALNFAMSLINAFWYLPRPGSMTSYNAPDPSRFNQIKPEEVPTSGWVLAITIAREVFYGITVKTYPNSYFLITALGFPPEIATPAAAFITSLIYVSYAVFFVELFWGRVFES